MCVIMFLLSGCEGAGGKHSVEDVEKAVSDFIGLKYSVERLDGNNYLEADNCTGIFMTTFNVNKEYKFGTFTALVFDSQSDANSYFEKIMNNELDFMYLQEHGSNYCYCNDQVICDAFIKYHFYIKDNVVFVTDYSTSEKHKSFRDFCDNDLPKFADSLD